MAVALVVSGCGSSGVPSGAVASVGGNPISLQAVNHWLYVKVKSGSAEDPTAPVIVPNDPPQFTSCVTQVKADFAEYRKDTDAQVRKLCSGAFTELNGEVLDFIIRAYWYQAYAHKLGITITDAEVAKQLKTEEQSAGLKTPAAVNGFLSENGYTLADLQWQVRFSLAFNKIESRIEPKVTQAAIAAYYKAHASTFGSPETRNMRIVLAKNAATAQTALNALKHGQSWTTVAKKYSTDPTTKDNGGLLDDVAPGEQDAALTKAAFAAPVNQLIGPVKGTFGYYVVEVIKITPATQQPLAKVSSQIKQTLSGNAQTKAQSTINAAVDKLYKSKTLCNKLYSISDCSGYKKPKATATSSTGAATSAASTTASSSATTSAPTTTSSTTTSKKKK